MNDRVCSQCGKKVVGEKCFNSNCKTYWQNFWEKKAKENINDYQNEVNLLQETNTELTLEDYLRVIKIKSEVNKWEKELQASQIKSEVEKLIRNIEELRKKFPKKIKLQSLNKNGTCSHRNIQWDDFFQKEKKNNAWCLDCGEDKSNSFSKAFQKWYYKEIEKLLVNKSLKISDFTNFLRKKDYYNTWIDLKRARLEEQVIDNFGQDLMWYITKIIEEYCLEFAKDKGINVDNNNNHRERERERANLQQQITNLENKPNKTVEEERELKDKKELLAKLENNTQNNNDNPWLKPTLIIGAGLLIIGVVVVLITKKSKNKR